MTTADLPGWLLTYAAHSTLLLGLAWLANRNLQSHAIKDLLWKTALIGGLVTTSLQRANIGALGRYGFRLEMPAASRTVARLEPTTLAPIPKNHLDKVDRSRSASNETIAPIGPVTLPNEQVPPALAPRLPAFDAPGMLLGLWALIAALLVIRFIAARWRLASGFGRRAPVAEGTLTMMLAELRTAAGIRRRLKLTHSAGLASPVAFGVAEICLPDAVLTDLDLEQQHSVLAHELAHLARFDPLWLDMAGVLERIFFFQPLNVLARKRIQDGAEYLCDDWAVRRTGSGLTLAKCLVKVAEWMEGTPHAVPVSGMAEHRSQLVSRIHRLIGNHAMRTGPRPRWLVPASAVLLIATAAFAPGFSSGTTNNQTGTAALSSGEIAAMASDTDTVFTATSKLARERALTEAQLASDRNMVRASRVMTTSRLSELRSELSEKNRAMTYARLDMKAAKLATTLNGVVWKAGDGRGRDTNSVAVPALLEALKDPAVEVRRAAAQSLANLEDPRTVPGLIDALKDSDKEVRQSSAQGLGQLRDERAIDGLIAVMRDADPEVRQAAVEALGELRSQKAIPGFTYALKDENKEVRRASIQALGSLENPKPVDALIAALKDNDGDVREAAVNALDGSEDKRAVAPLIALLADPDADVRQATCSALGSLRDPSAAQPISNLLKDSNADVRESCTSALGNMELKSAPAGLIDALKDPKADVRQRAAETIGSIQDAKAVPSLKLLLDDSNGDVREAAIDALSNISDRSALDALIGALKSKDANVRKRAAEALGHREE